MKLQYFIVSLFIVLFTSIKANSQNCGTIKIYRPWNYVGSVVKANIRINNQQVVKIPNKSKLSFYTQNEGTFTVSLSWPLGGRTEEKVHVKCGETVYLQIFPGKLAVKNQLQQIPENTAIGMFDKIPEAKHIILKPNNYNPNVVAVAVNERIDNQAPTINITSPDVSRGFKVTKPEKQITITGQVTDDSGIYEILVNGEPANIDVLGNFSKNVLLAIGDNTFTVSATDIKRNTSTESFVITRQAIQQNPLVTNRPTISNTTNIKTGNYYALIIGNNEYQDPSINSLNEPINDASKLYNVLTREYTFAPQNVRFIKNASYVQMIEALDQLSNQLTEEDNLLIFYAGHGWWDDRKGLGYWLPSNAKQNSTAFWIRNSTISDYMGSIKTKHTLLIADACFSGSIFKTRAAFSDAGQAINSLYKLPSRSAMTSGNLKEVPDKSVFLEYLVKRLDNNTEKYLSADQLFASFRIAVMNNSTVEPQFGTIQNTGDEGGEFIFIKK